MQELLISGDTISLVEKKIIHTTTIEAFKQSMINSAPTSTGILPVGCKAMLKKPSASLACYVVERQPGITALAFHRDKGNAKSVKDYKISLPFIQFYIALRECPLGYALKGLYLSCSKVPITDEKSEVAVLPLPNIFGNGEGKVCTGEISVSMGSPAVICEDIISSFFAAPSNLDLSMDYPRELRSEGNDHQNCLRQWQTLSESNPLFGISNGINYRKFTNHSSTFIGRMMFAAERD